MPICRSAPQCLPPPPIPNLPLVYPSTAFFVYDPRYGEAGSVLKEAFTRYHDLAFPHGTMDDKGASMKSVGAPPPPP